MFGSFVSFVMTRPAGRLEIGYENHIFGIIIHSTYLDIIRIYTTIIQERPQIAKAKRGRSVLNNFVLLFFLVLRFRFL